MVDRATARGIQMTELWAFWQNGAEGAELGWLQTIANHRKILSLKIPICGRDNGKHFLRLIKFTILFPHLIDFIHGW